MRRIDDRPPDAFAVAGQDRQAVAVVDFRPPVPGLRVRVSPYQNMLENGRYADPIDIRTDIRRASISMTHAMEPLGCVTRLVVHAVSAGDAWPVEQRVYDDRSAGLGRRFKPILREAWKFLVLRHRRIDGDATRRQTVLVVGTGASEIGRAHGSEPIGLQIFRHDAKAREPRARAEPFGRMPCRDFEQILIVDELACFSAFHKTDADRIGRILVHMEELDRVMSRAVEIHGAVGPVTDALRLIVIYFGEDVWRRRDRRLVAVAGEALRFLVEDIERERFRCLELILRNAGGSHRFERVAGEHPSQPQPSSGLQK